MGRTKWLPYGVSDFNSAANRSMHYVDKTMGLPNREERGKRLRPAMPLVNAGCLIAGLLALALTACTESIEDKAAREAEEYTQKMCPTPWVNDSRTDSAAFDKASKTFTYYLTLRGKADNAEVIKANKEKLRQAQKTSLDGNPGIKTYKENHFAFRFVYYSESQKGTVLIDESFKY